MTTDTHPPVVFLRGEHVYARPLELADADQCQRWMNDPEIWSPLGTFLPMNWEKERNFITLSQSRPECVQLAIVTSDDDNMIGMGGLMNIRWKDRAASFDVIIGEANSRGRGYGTDAAGLILNYAFKTLNLNRVELEVLASNEPAIHLYEKVGFQPEGVRRECHFVNGHYQDGLIFSILAHEYHTAIH